MKNSVEYRSIPHREILTGQEHLWIGSSPMDDRMIEDPFIPQALLDGASPEAVQRVNELRREQEGIGSMSASLYFAGIPEDEFWQSVMGLSEVDPMTGHIIAKEPRLIAIFKDDGTVIKDRGELDKFHLTDEGRKTFFVPEGSRKDPEGSR